MLHAKFTSLMQTHDIPLTSFAEAETTNLPLRFRATLVPQESSGETMLTSHSFHAHVIFFFVCRVPDSVRGTNSSESRSLC